MIRRLRAIVRPGDAHAHGHAAPSPREAFAGWMLGSAWALVCLWLGDVGTHSLVPGAIVGGVIAVWGWRHLEWLSWLPAAVVVAVLLEPLAPPDLRGRFGPLAYVNLLMAGITLVAVVRSVVLRRPLLPRTSLDGAALALLVCLALGALSSAHRIAPLAQGAVVLAVYYATASVASFRGGSRWVWPAYPLAVLLAAVQAVWAYAHGAAAPPASDGVPASAHLLADALLCALPVTIGLACDAGDRAARAVWRGVALLGSAGLLLSLRALVLPQAGFDVGVFRDPLRLGAAGIAWAALFAVARMAWRLRRQRPHEAPRWIAIALTCAAAPFLQLAFAGGAGLPSELLLATGAGLIVGACRSDARTGVVPVDVPEPLRRAA